MLLTTVESGQYAETAYVSGNSREGTFLCEVLIRLLLLFT